MDPNIHHKYSPYVGIDNSPIHKIDPDGRDGIVIIGQFYPSGGVPGTGHAGVLLIDDKTGYTRYYEYGRYDSENYGMVRSYPVPNVEMGEDGKPTVASLNNVFDVIAKNSFTKNRGTDKEKTYDLTGAYFESDQFDKMKSYADKRQSEGTNGEEFSILSNNCGDFASEVVSSANDVSNLLIDITSWANPAPSTLIEDLKAIDDFTIFHSTEDGKTQIGHFGETYEKENSYENSDNGENDSG